MDNGFKWKIGTPTEEDWTSVAEYFAEIRKRLAEEDDEQ